MAKPSKKPGRRNVAVESMEYQYFEQIAFRLQKIQINIRKQCKNKDKRGIYASRTMAEPSKKPGRRKVAVESVEYAIFFVGKAVQQIGTFCLAMGTLESIARVQIVLD